jgi:hypothetical protein
MAVPIAHEIENTVIPTLIAAIRKLPFRTLHRTIAAIPSVICAGKIHHVGVVADPVSNQTERHTIPIAIRDHARVAIATIAAVPIKFFAHEIRRKVDAIIAHSIPDPSSRMAVPVAIRNFPVWALRH